MKLGQEGPNYGPTTSLIRPAKHLAHFFKHDVSDYGQQCNVIGCSSAAAALSCTQRYKSVNKMVRYLLLLYYKDSHEFNPRVKKLGPLL